MQRVCLSSIVLLLLAGCGGGSGDSEGPTILSDATSGPDPLPESETPTGELPPTVENSNEALAADAASVTYSVTLASLWLVDDYPQGFPDDAHLSHIGGATHNAAVSFWEPGAVLSRGMEDMAETGRIEILLADEVAPAIENGTADSSIAFREYVYSSTDALARGVDNKLTFELEMKRAWPRVTLVTMLGPSPDWFVGIDGLALYSEGAWQTEMSVDLPLHDGGSKSGVEPFMGGPDIIPPLPVSFAAYDPASGTYQPSETPQTIARISFERLR